MCNFVNDCVVVVKVMDCGLYYGKCIFDMLYVVVKWFDFVKCGLM